VFVSHKSFGQAVLRLPPLLHPGAIVPLCPLSYATAADFAKKIKRFFDRTNIKVGDACCRGQLQQTAD